MSFKVKVEGFREMEQSLFLLKNTTAKATVRRAIKKSLEQTKVQAKLKAPVFSGPGGGDLEESIIIGRVSRRHKKHQKSEVELAVGPRGGKGGIAYAAQQEFGNVNHGAQPFMRPAWDNTKMGVLVTFKDEMWIELEKSLLRHSRKLARDAAKLKR